MRKTKKAKVIKGAQGHDKDTGSSKVQVAIYNARVEDLSEHLKKNKKDHPARRTLLKLVAKRRQHEKYLSKKGKSASKK